jgi:hypothetical protein
MFMRTSTPKVLGWVSILYALLIHAFDVVSPLIVLTGLVISWETAGLSVSRFLLNMLPLIYFSFYFVGGIGLLMFRRGAALLVLLAAVSELIYDIGIYSISDRLGDAAGLPVMTLVSILLTFIVPTAIAFFSWRIWRRFDTLPEPSRGEREPSETETEQAVSSGKSYYRYMLLTIIVFGMIIPVSTGIAVKLYLDSVGEPTLPWSYFLNIPGLILLLPLSVWWSIPYLILVYAARNIRTTPFWGLKTYKARLIFISSVFAGGCLISIGIFVSVFVQFDPLILFVPLWIVFLPHLVAGLLICYVIAKVVEVYLNNRASQK